MNEIKTTKQIGQCGTSLTINVTKESRALNLGRGDYVEITIKPVDDESLSDLLDYLND